MPCGRGARRPEGALACVPGTLQIRQGQRCRVHEAIEIPGHECRKTGCVTSGKSLAFAEPNLLSCKTGLVLPISVNKKAKGLATQGAVEPGLVPRPPGLHLKATVQSTLPFLLAQGCPCWKQL